MHETDGIGHLLLRQAFEVENAAVEQRPGQHVAIRHGLGDMVHRSEGAAGGLCRHGFEIPAPVFAVASNEIEQAAADAPDRGNFQFARSHGLAKQRRLQCFGARQHRGRIIDFHGDRANA